MVFLAKKDIQRLYFQDKRSLQEISKIIGVSTHTICYWMDTYKLPRCNRSDALYIRYNPNGNPFMCKNLVSHKDWFLFGLGIGLYWGEGTKSNTHSVRLGNTDPHLIKTFLLFLKRCYEIDEKKLHFGLQVFRNMSAVNAKEFWKKHLNIEEKQFQKIIVTPTLGVGTYRKKTQYGVLTIYFNNKKLRDILVGEIEKMKKIR